MLANEPGPIDANAHISPRMTMAKMDRAQHKRMRVNVLCLAGALLSLGCCLLSWTVSHAHTIKSGTEVIQLSAPEFALQTSWADLFHFIMGGMSQWPQVVLGAQIFLAGVALSFASPVGGFVQFGGIALFRASINDYLGTHPGNTVVSISTSMNFAFYLSVVGALVVIGSLFFQFSPDFQWSTTKLKDRLFVYSTFRPEAKPARSIKNPGK